MERPTPGLDGTFTGTCIACRTATDTGLGVVGEPEWHVAFLTNLGIPVEEATIMIKTGQKELDERGYYRAVYRVCTTCAAKTTFPKPALAVAGDLVPTVSQPLDTQPLDAP